MKHVITLAVALLATVTLGFGPSAQAATRHAAHARVAARRAPVQPKAVAATPAPSCCAGGNCCQGGASCCAMPGCCQTDGACCAPDKGACTDACGCPKANCCG